MKKDLNSKIELVAPAGSPANLDAAIGEGADAVYLGLHNFNARIRAKNFAYNQFEALVSKVHDLNKKVYLTLNIVFENWELNHLFSLLKYVDIVKPDAVIVQDLGLIKMINENFPTMKISASTQMNIASAKAVNLLSKHGVKRVVLSRELSFNEIESIRAETNAELEIFAHGSLCVSFSGLCLFSSYYGGKSANKGKCTQACRRLYQNQFGKSGHFFSPSDLMLLQYIPDMEELGIDSIKLEGRMKSAGYVASVVKAYRYMIDNYSLDREDALRKSIEILHGDMARAKTTYFFKDRNNLSYINPDEKGEIGEYIGEIDSIKKDEDSNYFALIKSNSTLYIGDTLRVVNKKGTFKKSIVVKSIEITPNKNVANENLANIISIPIDETIEKNMMIYLVARRESDRKYPHIIPSSLSKYTRHPGVHIAPPAKNGGISKKGLSKIFDRGIYVKTNNLNDLYIIQSVRPKKVILELNRKNMEMLKKNLALLPFSSKEIIIYLPPYTSPLVEDFISSDIKFLLENKFNQFVINNLAHIQILKNRDVSMIGGPYLYTFNKYAAKFLTDLGVMFFISPFENNKKNLFSMFDSFDPAQWFITIFGYPELFQINANLGKKYNFTMVTDSEKK